MTAQIITYPRKPTAAEAHVIYLADRPTFAERALLEKIQPHVSKSVALLNEMARLTRKDGER